MQREVNGSFRMLLADEPEYDLLAGNGGDLEIGLRRFGAEGMHDDQRWISVVVLCAKQLRIAKHDGLHGVSHAHGCCKVRQHVNTPRRMAVGLIMNHVRLDDGQHLVRIFGQIRGLAEQQRLKTEASDKQNKTGDSVRGSAQCPASAA